MTSELSCFLLFFTFSLSLQPLFLSPSLHLLLFFGEEYSLVQGQLWSPRLLLAQAADRFRRMERVWRSDFVRYLPSVCLLPPSPGWKKKEWKLNWLRVKKLREDIEEGKYDSLHHRPSSRNHYSYLFLFSSYATGVISNLNMNWQPCWKDLRIQ